MELSGLARETARHLVYTQRGSARLCVRLRGASSITHPAAWDRGKALAWSPPTPRSLPVEITASSVFSEDGGYTNSDGNEVFEGEAVAFLVGFVLTCASNCVERERKVGMASCPSSGEKQTF